MSSAHVYLRLPEGHPWREIPETAMSEAGALTKANSIKGCKLASVKMVYTPASNLKKTGDMEVGQVGFYRYKDRLHFTQEKDKHLVKALAKTKAEITLDDFKREVAKRDAARRVAAKHAKKAAFEAEKAAKEAAIAESKLRSYDSMFDGADEWEGLGDATADASGAAAYEDDFM